MVSIEIVEEVISDYLLRLTFATQCISNEFQIFIQCLCTIDCFHKLYEQTDNIILKVFIVTNRDNVILIGRERHILAGIPFSAGVSKTVHIKRVSTKHTSHSVGNERTNITPKVCLADGYIFILDLWCHLVLQSINGDENAVQFFLVDFQLTKTVITFSLPLVKGFCNGGYFVNQWVVLEIP